MNSLGSFSSIVEGRTASREHDRNFSLARIDEGWSASDLSEPDGGRLVGILGFMIEAIYSCKLADQIEVWIDSNLMNVLEPWKPKILCTW